MHKLIESKEMSTYQKLLNVLGDYCGRFPATGMDNLLTAALDNGKKICPNEKLASSIVSMILHNDSEPAAISDLQNKRFVDLPVEVRPIYRDGNKHRVAFWNRGENISDKVRHLIDFEGSGKNGKWCDAMGKGVKLITEVE